MDKEINRLIRRVWSVIHADERGLTTLEYVLFAGIIIVVLGAAILAWNNGLADRINELVRLLRGG